MKPEKLIARIPKRLFLCERNEPGDKHPPNEVVVRIKKPSGYRTHSGYYDWKHTVIPNNPVEKIRVVAREKRYNCNDLWIIEFPLDGRILRTNISPVSLESLLTSGTLMIEEGWIKGPFIWAILNQRVTTLVTAETELGLEVAESSKIFNGRYLKEKDAVVGGVYQTRQKDLHMFLGEICWDEIVSTEHEPIRTETKTGNVWSSVPVNDEEEHLLSQLHWKSEKPSVIESLVATHPVPTDFMEQGRKRLLCQNGGGFYRFDYVVYDYPRATARRVGEPCPEVPKLYTEEARLEAVEAQRLRSRRSFW